MKKIVECYMKKYQNKERAKGAAVGAVVGAAVGVIAGVLLKDEQKRAKICESSRKIVKEAEKIANEAKRIVVNKASQCCNRNRNDREIVEIYPDDEE